MLSPSSSLPLLAIINPTCLSAIAELLVKAVMADNAALRPPDSAIKDPGKDMSLGTVITVSTSVATCLLLTRFFLYQLGL